MKFFNAKNFQIGIQALLCVLFVVFVNNFWVLIPVLVSGYVLTAFLYNYDWIKNKYPRFEYARSRYLIPRAVDGLLLGFTIAFGALFSNSLFTGILVLTLIPLFWAISYSTFYDENYYPCDCDDDEDNCEACGNENSECQCDLDAEGECGCDECVCGFNDNEDVDYINSDNDPDNIQDKKEN